MIATTQRLKVTGVIVIVLAALLHQRAACLAAGAPAAQWGHLGAALGAYMVFVTGFGIWAVCRLRTVFLLIYAGIATAVVVGLALQAADFYLLVATDTRTTPHSVRGLSDAEALIGSKSKSFTVGHRVRRSATKIILNINVKADDGTEDVVQEDSQVSEFEEESEENYFDNTLEITAKPSKGQNKMMWITKNNLKLKDVETATISETNTSPKVLRINVPMGGRKKSVKRTGESTAFSKQKTNGKRKKKPWVCPFASEKHISHKEQLMVEPVQKNLKKLFDEEQSRIEQLVANDNNQTDTSFKEDIPVNMTTSGESACNATTQQYVFRLGLGILVFSGFGILIQVTCIVFILLLALCLWKTGPKRRKCRCKGENAEVCCCPEGSERSCGTHNLCG